MQKDIRVFLSSGYAGKVEAWAVVENKHYRIETNYLTEKLENEIKEKGYTTSITNRQKYPRLIINI